MPEGWLRRPRARWRALPVTIRDGVLATAFLVLTQAELFARAHLLEGPPVLQHLLLACICGSVTLRRTRPTLAAAVCGVGMAATGALGTAPSAAVYVVYLLVTYSVGWYASSRRAAALGLAALVLPDAVVYPLTQPEGRNIADIVINAGIPVALWLLARLGREHLDRAIVAERRLAAEQLRAVEERARRSEAAAAERRRIARECHDVIGHGITLMLLYTEAAQARLGDREQAAAEALDVAAAAGRTALADVRQVLDVLRAGDDVDPGAGGLDEVAELVERVRGAGANVDWHAIDLPADLPATVSTTAYRVVQEALTNALRHAPGAPVQVSLCRDRDALRVQVVDAGSTAATNGSTGSSGFGLAGLQERVGLLGGQLAAGPLGDRPGWQVTASLPIAPARR
ncbi:sensor histidine kinase [Blastococcus deserti]|uniref:histidine kinase n=1 Tax=Blastococcus deserti TaxID=2259033 RepID=A0ABW4XDN5_9ACTN